jgi:beta-lactamase class A
VIARALLASAVLLASLVAAEADACEIAPRFAESVRRVVGADRAETRTGFLMLVADRGTGATLCEDSVQPDQVIYPASSIKTLVAVAILRLVDSGALSLEHRLIVSQPNAAEECDADRCGGYAENGRRTTVRRLLDAMIRRSSNVATNQLIDVATKPFINETAEALGAPSLKVRRKVYVSIDPEPELRERNAATARGMGELYRELATGRLGVLRAGSRAYLSDLLGRTVHNGRFDAQFPSGVVFRHKTGSTSDSSSDAGYFELEDGRTVILVGLQAFRDVRTFVPIGAEAYRLLR